MRGKKTSPEDIYRVMTSYAITNNYNATARNLGMAVATVKNIVDELGDEKIDIIKYSDDPAEFICAALSPSKVVKVEVNEEEKSALVVVPDYQLSLAIGKEGQNARLAAKLTNWKIDIKSESQAGMESSNSDLDA